MFVPRGKGRGGARRFDDTLGTLAGGGVVLRAATFPRRVSLLPS